MNTPRFCPYSGCEAHFGPPEKPWFIRRGTYTAARDGRTQRYRCLLCGRSFSDATFSLDFHAHRRINYPLLFLLCVCCTGVRQVGRVMHLQRNLIGNRVMRLARQALAVQATFLRTRKLDEPVVIDGLRSFWISQYVPAITRNLNYGGLFRGSGPALCGLYPLLPHRPHLGDGARTPWSRPYCGSYARGHRHRRLTWILAA